MRPFNMSKITCRRSQARDEFNRLNLACWRTITIHGTAQEQASAQKHLTAQEDSQATQIARLFLDENIADTRKVAQVVEQLQNNKDGTSTKEGII